MGVTSDGYCSPGSPGSVWTQMFEWIDWLQRWDSLMLSSVPGFNLHPGVGLKGRRDFAAAAPGKSEGNSEDALGINGVL